MRTAFSTCIFAVVATLAWADPLPPAQLADIANQLKVMQESLEGLKKTVSEQQNQIDSLKQENERLRTQQPAASPAAAPPVPAPPPPSAQKVAQSSTPEIGAVIDALATLSESREDDEGNDRLSLRELEILIGNDVDPFTRLDATITFGDFEDPDIEEAYLTYLGLPYGIVAKVGRMRQKIGKESSVHRNQLDTVDDPLVVQEYLGTEGLFKTGLELSKFLPQIWSPVTHELTIGIMEGGVGDGGKMFEGPRRVPSYYAHLKNFWEISDLTNLELGATYLTGSADDDSRYEVNALGLDLTLNHYFTPTNKLKWQSELFYQGREESTVFNRDTAEAYINHITGRVSQLGTLAFNLVGIDPPFPTYEPTGNFDIGDGLIVSHYDEHPWGFYSLVDYRLSPRWGIGARFDYVQPVENFPLNPRDEDRAIAAYVTFYQSEFARMRLQYEHLEMANGADDDRLYLQGTYAVGVHKHAVK